MKAEEVYMQLQNKGLRLSCVEGKIRVWPKDKISEKEHELLKNFKEGLIQLTQFHHHSKENELHELHEHGKEFFHGLKKRKTNNSFSFDKKNKVIQVHNVHQVHSLNVLAENTKNLSVENEKVSSGEVRQLGAWFFGETEPSFDPHGDQAVYQTRSRQSAERMLNLVRDLTWPDFKAFVVDSSITLKRVKEKYYQRRTTIDWQNFILWWEKCGDFPQAASMFEAYSEKTAQEIIIKWNDIKKRAKGRFSENFSKYWLKRYMNKIFVTQISFIEGGPDEKKIEESRLDAVQRLIHEDGLSKSLARKIVGF